MTVCIAALADAGHSLILVADRMVGIGTITVDMDIDKVQAIHRDWRIMIAGGDIAPAFDIVDLTRKKLLRRRALSVSDVMKHVSESYSSVRSAKAATLHLAPHGYTLQQFHRTGLKELGKDLFEDIEERFAAYDFDIELLVAGFDSQGNGHIFKVGEHGQTARETVPGFDAIGSGAPAAIHMMFQRELTSKAPLRRCLYYAVEGKYFGELAEGVGTRTVLYVLRHNKRPIQVSEEVLEKILFVMCGQLEPKDLGLRHLKSLNKINLWNVPKLSIQTRRRN